MITIHQHHRQTDRRTDRQTTCDRNTALRTKVHRAVKNITTATIRASNPGSVFTIPEFGIGIFLINNRKAKRYVWYMTIWFSHSWWSDDLTAVQHVDGSYGQSGNDGPVMDGYSCWLFSTLLSDAIQCPFLVAAVLLEAAELAETSGDIRREVTETAGCRDVDGLLRPTAHCHLMARQLVKHLPHYTSNH